MMATWLCDQPQFSRFVLKFGYCQLPGTCCEGVMPTVFDLNSANCHVFRPGTLKGNDYIGSGGSHEAEKYALPYGRHLQVS